MTTKSTTRGGWLTSKKVLDTSSQHDNGGGAGSRIPKTLQAVFLASNRGNDVHKPPPKQVAFKMFTLRGWRKSSSSSQNQPTEEDTKRMIEASYQKKTKKSSTTSKPITSTNKSEKKIENPQACLDRIMKSRGYCTKRYDTLQTAYHNKPTALQNASYDVHLIGLVKGNDGNSLQDILQAGISANPCNTYGESLVHMVCRRGNDKLLQIMIENGCDLQVADDYGRTPLHDACWAAEPAFDTVELLLGRDVTLFQMQDCRGFLPLSYVRKDHWPAWNDFLDKKKDVYWPNLMETTYSEDDDDDHKSFISTVSTVCEFVEQNPNTRPISDPKHALPLDLANQVASGKLSPEEAIRLRNQRMSKKSTIHIPNPIAEEENHDDDSEQQGSTEETSESDDSDDSDYDSDDDDDEDFDDDEMEELINTLTIQLSGASTSNAGVPCVTISKQ